MQVCSTTSESEHFHLLLKSITKTAVRKIYNCIFINGYTEQDAIDFLYSRGFDSLIMTDKCILAATSAAVDKWNETILLPNPEKNCSLNADFVKLMIQTDFLPECLQWIF